MRLVSNDDHRDPTLHLALEEHCIRRLPGDIEVVLLYVNSACVVIGRNQNPLQEADWSYLRREAIPWVRRISGGGAVFHDAGNLNFSVIGPAAEDRRARYRLLTGPIRRVLRDMGIAADWNDRNDLVVDGRKVSGNAQYVSRGRWLAHGTLLFDADLAVMSRALAGTLRPSRSKATASVRSPVANLSDLLGRRLDMEAFRGRILEALSAAGGPVGTLRLDASDWREIHGLADGKYRSWDWNMGKTPGFVHRADLAVGGQRVALSLHVERAAVSRVEVLAGGDAGGAAAEVLEGCRFDVAAFERRLAAAWRLAVSGEEVSHAARRLFGAS